MLSDKGIAWPLLHESLSENNTIENMERIFKAAKSQGFEVFISPHYFYPTDKGWKFNGPLEADEASAGMFARKGILNLDGLRGSGADWLERFRPYIEDGKTVVVAPHRVFGPETILRFLQPGETDRGAAMHPTSIHTRALWNLSVFRDSGVMEKVSGTLAIKFRTPLSLAARLRLYCQR